MFWFKPLVVLGILATIGNTAPLAFLEQDRTASQNATGFLSKRVDFDAIEIDSQGVWVFRTDSRHPKEIEAAGGFFSMAEFKGKTPDYSLYNHCGGADESPHSADDDAWVGTSSSFNFCKTWLEEKFDNGVIYQIAADQNLISCQATLGDYNPLPEEFEYAAFGIPFDQVMGWYDRFKRRPNGDIYDGEWTDNTKYNAQKYAEKNYGEPQRQHAGFPLKHDAWKDKEFKPYAPCNKSTDEKKKMTQKDQKKKGAKKPNNLTGQKKQSRSFVELFVRGIMDTFSLSNKITVTTPKSTPPKSTPPKSTPPKTCTAADKKAGKCGGGPKETCASRKTSKQLFDEYYRLYKAGKLPKPASPSTKGSKQRPGRKIGR